MPKNDFYKKLPEIDRFQDMTNMGIFRPLPDDWYVVVTDVVNSKIAIEEGKYKEVNTIGAACITSVVNELDPMEIPYVFGGDGASLCVPPSAYDKVKSVLVGTQNMAKLAFNLELRAGIIPVKDIRDKGKDVLVARYKVNENYTQALFAGGGLVKADSIIKSDDGEEYRFVSSSQRIEADFTGLECRWKKVSQEKKMVSSLLIEATKGDQVRNMSLYGEIIDEISKKIPSDHPVTEPALKFSFNPTWLSNEVKTRTFMKGLGKKLVYFADLYYQNIIGAILMKFNIKISGFNWGKYKSQFIANTDYRKFDDMLRVVISSTDEERAALLSYLDQKEKHGEIRYGIHTSNAAIVTCMVKKYNGLHFHFVDGDDGGYAMAAKDMIRKMEAV
ncbi:DUF3095 domain-containing protein [Balneola sp. MJW-20]|uniref:DUF3095 domain-containing protein n=1 Tax=Gracilimonas aurantiaca TaxID=3234185 RepID=UPI0034660A8E